MSPQYKLVLPKAWLKTLTTLTSSLTVHSFFNTLSLYTIINLFIACHFIYNHLLFFITFNNFLILHLLKLEQSTPSFSHLVPLVSLSILLAMETLSGFHSLHNAESHPVINYFLRNKKISARKKICIYKQQGVNDDTIHIFFQ